MPPRSQTPANAQAAFLQNILQAIPHPAYVIDADTFFILHGNAETSYLAGTKHWEAKTCHKLIFGYDEPCDWCPVLQYRENRELHDLVSTFCHVSRKTWYTLHSSIFCNLDGRTIAFMVAKAQLNTPEEKSADVTSAILGNPEVASSTVSYTHFLSLSSIMLEQARAENTPMAIMSLQVMGLHHINTMYGFALGDEILRTIVQTVSAALPREALFARQRGNDFTVLLPLNRVDPHVSLQDTLGRISVAMDSYEATTKYARCRLQLGVCLFPDHGQSLNNLERRARQAARACQDSHEVYSCGHYNEAAMTQQRELGVLKDELLHALREDEMELYFQPKYEAVTSSLRGVEALLRWNHPTRGLLYPGTFIPLAEEAFIIPEVDNWVIDMSCTMWRKVMDEHCTLVPLAINISPQKFYQPDLLERLENATSRNNLPPSMLEIELTEGSALKDMNQAVHIMKQLRAKGYHIAMDDFGTGYSSLSYLRSLPFDTIKLDKNFINDSDPKTRTMLMSLVSLLKLYGTRIVIEGVETREQFNFSCDAGCDLIQGYFFERPMPFDALIRLLKSSHRRSGQLMRHEKRWLAHD